MPGRSEAAVAITGWRHAPLVVDARDPVVVEGEAGPAAVLAPRRCVHEIVVLVI